MTLATFDQAPVQVYVGMTLAQAEKALIEKTLASVHGDIRFAAVILGVCQKTIYNKLALYKGGGLGRKGGSGKRVA